MMKLKQTHANDTPILLLAYNAPREVCSLAEKKGCQVLRIPPWERLPAPICGHPDMLVFPLACEDGSPNLLLPAEYYKNHADFWRKSGFAITLTEHPFSDAYPADVGLNQLVMKGRLYGRLDAAATEVLKAYSQQTNVRQGYARCSVMKLGENAAVTADRSLAHALTAHGVDVLLISAGHIRLDGYNYGFIGGASFPLPDNTVCLFGDLHGHPDCEAIAAFAERHGVRLCSTEGELTDWGGGLLIQSPLSDK